MEFDFDINNVLKDTISLITGNQKVLNQRNDFAELQEVIDTAGVKSAKAQRLSAPITSLSKLRINAHRIYILTNKTSTTRASSVIGFIKVGIKQLFVLDHDGTHHQTHPLCVLDFYIHESHQRKGYGLKLFKHMLQSEHVHPSHLAIDRPSQKFTSFLRKHFNLWATIPQVNNFVVFDGYFKNRRDNTVKNRHRQMQEYNEFRPLSRAFTESSLHPNIRTIDSNTLNGIRPATNTCADGAYDFGQNREHFKQNHRSNTFSRYANENRYAQTYHKRNAHLMKQDKEIVANSYRNSPSSETQMLRDSIGASPNYEQISQNGKSPALDLEAVRDSPIESEILYDRNRSVSKAEKLKMFEPTTNEQNMEKSTDENSMITNGFNPKFPKKELFEAKMNHNSMRGYRYKNPSDMINELKKKDEALSNRNPSYIHRYALGSTSWNVFGIPSPSRFANR